MSKENPVFFISYARDDKEHYVYFKKLFIEQKPENWKTWTDQDIELGEEWESSINIGMEKCDIGLLLLSGAFKNSKFIKSKELPYLVDKKRIIPVLLKPFDYYLDTSLSKFQIFENPRNNYDKAFSHTTIKPNGTLDQESSKADDFVKDLVVKIVIGLKSESIPLINPEPELNPNEILSSNGKEKSNLQNFDITYNIIIFSIAFLIIVFVYDDYFEHLINIIHHYNTDYHYLMIEKTFIISFINIPFLLFIFLNKRKIIKFELFLHSIYVLVLNFIFFFPLFHCFLEVRSIFIPIICSLVLTIFYYIKRIEYFQ